MLGTWRLLLAVLVVVAHLYRPPWPGHFAVFGFYVISGFLMTLIMHEKYHYTPVGFGKYLLNRFLRIYPPFYLACGLTLVLIAVLPEGVPQAFRPTLSLPESLGNALAHVTLVGLDFTQPARLVPPAWALHVEVFFYLAIGAGLGRTRGIALAWLALSVAYLVWLNNSPQNSFAMRYYVIPAGSLPFSVGCLVYHFRGELGRILPWRRRWLVLALLAYVLPWVGFAVSGGRGLNPWFYVNIFTSGVLVHLLFAAPKQTMPRLARLDAWLGDLCYPVYLLHWQAGLIVAWLWDLPAKGVITLLLGLGLTLLLAMGESAGLSRPLDRLRRRVAAKKFPIAQQPPP